MKNVKMSFGQAIIFYIIYIVASCIVFLKINTSALVGMGGLIVFSLVVLGYGFNIVILSIIGSILRFRGVNQIVISLKKFSLLLLFQSLYIALSQDSFIFEYLLVYFLFLLVFSIDVLRISTKEVQQINETDGSNSIQVNSNTLSESSSTSYKGLHFGQVAIGVILPFLLLYCLDYVVTYVIVPVLDNIIYHRNGFYSAIEIGGIYKHTAFWTGWSSFLLVVIYSIMLLVSFIFFKHKKTFIKIFSILMTVLLVLLIALKLFSQIGASEDQKINNVAFGLDEQQCGKLNNQKSVAECLYLIAEQKVDSSICDKIDASIAMSNGFDYYQSQCYQSIATIKKDPSYCQKINNYEQKNDCFYSGAIITNISSFCDNIDLNYQKYPRENCYKGLRH